MASFLLVSPTTWSQLPAAAIITRQPIALNGNGISTDSYNSQDPAKSTNGKYDASRYQGDEGDVIAGITSSAILIGNANIYGKVHVGAGTSVQLGSNGGIGSHVWQVLNSGAQPGWVLQDANFVLPDISFPNTSSFLGLPAGGVIVNVNTNQTYITNTYDYILAPNNRYVAGSVGGKKTYVAGRNVTIVLTNGLNGTETITWAQGAGLTLYCGGPTCSVTANNILNPNGNASSFTVYATSSVTNVALSGNAATIGIIFAPHADARLTGGGSAIYDFCGMIVVNSLTVFGHYAFHFDESLSYQAYNIAAMLTGASARFSGGKFGFNVSGVSGLSYVVEASTNLADWFPLATNTAPFSFGDPDSPNCPARFYRAVYKGGP